MTTRKQMLTGLAGILALGRAPAQVLGTPMCRVCNLDGPKPYLREVAYLETSSNHGNCYVPTGVVPDINTRVEITASCIGHSGWTDLITSQTSDNSPDTFQIRVYGTEDYWCYKIGDVSKDPALPFIRGRWSTLILDKDSFSDGTSSVAVSASSYSVQPSYDLWLFTCHRANGSAYNRGFHGRISSCKIWNSDVLVRNMIPVIGMGMEPAFFDKVNNEMHYGVEMNSEHFSWMEL